MSLDEGSSQAQSISTVAASALSNHLTEEDTASTAEEALAASMADPETSEAHSTGGTHMQKQHQLDTSHILQGSLSSLASNAAAAAEVAAQQVLSAAVPSTGVSGVEGSEGARLADPSTSAIVSPSFITTDAAAAASTSVPTTSAPSNQQTENSQTHIPSSDSIPMLNSSNAASVCTSVPSMASIPSNADPTSEQHQQQQQILLHESLLAQQAAFLAAMNSTTQLNMVTAAQQTQPIPEKQMAILPLQTSPVSHTNHSRSTSVIDGMVAMFPNDSSSTATPRSGVMVVPSVAGSSTQPIANQIQLQLQLHQQQLEQQFAINQTAASNASTFASANHSGVPSPFATPSGAFAAGTVAPGHRRQLSSTTPGTLQQQQQQQLSLAETPTSLSTAPPTLVPGTPTTFGQLQFPPQAQPSNGAGSVHPSHHHHHSHFGHSRHLSLDNASFRLLSGEASAALHTLPLHETIQEHQARMAQGLQNRATGNAILALQQQQQQVQQMQQQQQLLQQQQQFQAQAHALSQQKAVSMSSRTVPITPQTPITTVSTTGAFQASSLADSLIQHQQHNSHHRGGFIHHHSSASVDLGALSSAFHVAQLNHTLSGQISPAGIQSGIIPSLGMPQLQQHIQPHQLDMGANFQDLAKPGMPVGSSVDMSGAEDMADEDDCDDEGNSGEDTDKGDVQGAKRGSSKSGAIKSTVSRTKRPEAPYKRFRNSFIFFANERRKQWRRAHPEVTKIQNRGFIQEMSKVWNQMSAEEKAPYMRMAEVDKLRYEADVKKYGPLPTNTPPTSSSAGTSANTPPTTSAAANAAKSGEAGSAVLQVSVPSVVPIAPAPALTVATIPTAAQPGSAIDASCGSVSLSANGAQAGSDHKVATAAAAAVAAALTQTSPIAPAFIGHSSYPLPTEASGANLGLLNQQSYHMMLQQAFGQGASPQTVDFDQSCFVGPEAQSADVSAVGFNPFSGSPPIAADGAQQQHPAISGSRRGSVISASVPDALSNSSSNDRGADTPGSGNRGTSVNGPTITTLVGTKRKSSSDGQPLTSLPVSVKRFRNSFIYFVNARRQELQFSRNGSPTNIEVNNREFLKDMSTMWRAMSEDEKAPYLKLAEVDKERFAREMRKYELEHPDEFQKQSRHRRRRSSTTSNGISAGPTGLDAVGPEPSKLQSAATAVATMPFMQPSTAAYSLNLSLSGSGSVSPSGILPFSQSVVNGSAYSLSSMPAEAIVQELNRAVATSVTTPISTAVNTPLTTPLLSPNVPLPSSDKQPEIVQLSLGHVPSLPSVPEEVVVCTDAANTTPVTSSVGVAGSTAGFLATAPKVATLPTVLEGADEDVNI